MDNYYNNEIIDYVTNFYNAGTEIIKIYNSLNSLYAAFSTSSGVDIEKIRNDIRTVAGELKTIYTALSKAVNKTKERADSCDRCYLKYANASYPAYETKERKYCSGANVEIGSDGLIYVTRWYDKKLDFLETIGSFFVSSAGEQSDTKIIGTEEMFSS